MQVFNPYLPANEYIPDGEPHVFGDRVYVYGSHDRFNAPIFCLNDYVCWSAPVDDLSAWHCHGVMYRKKQDPANKSGLRLLFAPDVARGVDGRYYLYYTLDFMGVMGVAVSDRPEGPFDFLGHVHFRGGREWGSRTGDELPFDPAVLVDDDGRVYLYSGFATKVPRVASRLRSLRNSGCVVMELEQDMVTIKAEPKLVLPGAGEGQDGAYQKHAFFEASSIRKIDGQYVLVYSSFHNHELCYAISQTPTEGFEFGGTLVSLGDLFLNGKPEESDAVNYLGNTHGGMAELNEKPEESEAVNYLGNTHGGMAELNGQWYIFYHRQTNRHSYSRQACAEPLRRTADGGFLQAEVTSCGLNGAPLRGQGEYQARIACNLWSKHGAARYDRPFWKRRHPCITQYGKDGNEYAYQYIANMRDGSVAGFKYFDLQNVATIRCAVGGWCKGTLQVSDTPDFEHIAAELPVHTKQNAVNITAPLRIANGEKPLYFRYKGRGAMHFYAFELM